jgi:hypothetical protein
MKERTGEKSTPWTRNLYAILIGVLCALLLMEIIFRIIPLNYTGIGTTVEYRHDPHVGVTLAPNQRNAVFVKKCVVNDRIRTNRQGFRDDDWEREKRKPRIAIIGDSFMEALQVPDGSLLADLLELRFGSDVEVLNFGISRYSTVNEYLTYIHYVSPYRPDLVLLFFSSNDVMDNSLELLRRAGRRESVVASGIIDAGEYRIRKSPYVEDRDSFPRRVKRFLKQHSRSLVAIRQLTRRSGRRKKTAVGIPIGWHVYLPPDDRAWAEAWQITEHFLVRLAEAVNADGGRLIVFTIPNYERVCEDWQRQVSRYIDGAVPAAFDPYRPTERIGDIATKHGIELITLEPFFLAYRDEHRIAAIEFFYMCDGHFSELAHEVAADAVYAAVRDSFTVDRARRNRADPHRTTP